MLVVLSGITFMKGRFVLGIVALHVPFIGVYTAMPPRDARLAVGALALPRREARTLARRFAPDRPFAQRRNRLLDLIGGAPTRD